MCISSPSDIRVIKINTTLLAVFILSINYVLCSVSSCKVWYSELRKKHNFMRTNFQYCIFYCLHCPLILTCQHVTAQYMEINVTLQLTSSAYYKM
jgi:hypothetical protein